MKNLILLSLFLVVASCTPRQTEEKQDELREYRKLVREYTEKIETLEKEIASEMGDLEENRATAVEVIEIAPREFSSHFTATGTVEALKDVYISPEVNGQISAIPVSHGDQVKKGDLLIRLNTDVTRNNIDEVRTSLELANKIFEKQEQLWDKKIGSEVQYLEAKNNKESLDARLSTLQTQLELSSIRAPFSGIVDDIMVKTGELASPGMRLIRLVNLDEMKITADVSESFLSAVKQGDDVTLEFSSYPEIRINSNISRIGTVIDPVTRTFEVEVLVENPEQLLKPNMLSSVRIRDYSDPAALTVPSIILKQDFNGTFLFRLNEKANGQTAEKVYVETGRTVQDITKIAAGIDEGDKVIVAGYNIVSDGEPVRVTN
jgi:membrane fusion protein, multidrug efflux system